MTVKKISSNCKYEGQKAAITVNQQLELHISSSNYK